MKGRVKLGVVMAAFLACADGDGSRRLGIERDELAVWRACPPDSRGLVDKLEHLSTVAVAFDSIGAEQRFLLASDTTWQGAMILHIAPWLLPSDLLASVARSCWSHFETVSRSISAGRVPLRSGVLERELSNWDSCLRYNWGDQYEARVARHLKPLLQCLQLHTRQLVRHPQIDTL